MTTPENQGEAQQPAPQQQTTQSPQQQPSQPPQQRSDRPAGGGGPRPGGGGPRPGGGGPRSGGGGPRPGGRRGGGRPRYYARRKVCSFCVDKVEHIDYKNVDRFRRYLSDRYKIEARRKTGVCAKHQRALSNAIKRARHMALIPFTPDHNLVGRQG